MRATNIPYETSEADVRITEILEESDASYTDSKEIPEIEKLTFTNGFYVPVTALFVDIRGSSELSTVHTRPILGKIYRAYISECVAINNSNPNCREIFIEGDCVIGIFSTPKKVDVDSVFNTSAKLCSAIDRLNHHLEKKGYSTLTCGVGLDDGEALMIKAGYKGSGINEIIWIGKVLSEAARLCSQGSKTGKKRVQMSKFVYENLSEKNQSLLSPVTDVFGINIVGYEGDVINVAMNEWHEQHK